MKQLQILNDIAALVFPNLCLACEQPLGTGEKMICLTCQLTLPKTNYHLHHENPVEKHFWGRVHIEAATALYHYIKQTRVQHMIHQLKYKGRTDIGIHLGRLFGYQLQESDDFKNVDIITSVPLHKHKLDKRGYNQSDLLGEGLSETLQKPFDKNILVRNVFTQTQTRKSRSERWKNVDSIFSVPHPEKISGKHILLIDDVITTGSTLEACANEILKISGTKVSIAALAHATQ
ncbi:MAG: ComF family protein [Chitinophagales bacterium]